MRKYTDNDPKGWGGDPTRGAALGRSEINTPDEETYTTPLILKHVPIDKQGYDPNGTYFGTGERLYWLASDDGCIDRVFRAKDDAEALALAKAEHPGATLPEQIEGLEITVGEVELDEFTQGYLECALWSTLDDEGDALDSVYGVEDIAPVTLQEAVRECKDFQEAQAELLQKAYTQGRYTAETAGHDFWLTRNGHGAGFWDRGLGDIGDKLTEASKPYGEVDLYVGDDGLVYG